MDWKCPGVKESMKWRERERSGSLGRFCGGGYGGGVDKSHARLCGCVTGWNGDVSWVHVGRCDWYPLVEVGWSSLSLSHDGYLVLSVCIRSVSRPKRIGIHRFFRGLG